jgi:ribulose-5-phosphate 4-epimerase/fuculose-1-phosphate aldolase
LRPRSAHGGERADGRWVAWAVIVGGLRRRPVRPHAEIARRLLVLALLENDGVLVLGTSVLDTFGRLEVLEATAEMGLFFSPRSTPRSLPSRAK